LQRRAAATVLKVTQCSILKGERSETEGLEDRRRIERRIVPFAAESLCRLARDPIWHEC